LNRSGESGGGSAAVCPSIDGGGASLTQWSVSGQDVSVSKLAGLAFIW
jgi:hypothetical protein